MKTLALIFASAALCATPTLAADFVQPKHDHLFPEMSEFAFGFAPRSVGSPEDFPQLYRGDVVARVIADLSFWGEFGLGIAENGGTYRVIYFERRLPGKGSNTKCEAPIDRDLAVRAIAAWRIVLLGTRFSDDVVSGLDGAVFHFSMMESFEQPPGVKQRQPLHGMVWVPDPGSPPDELVKLADGLSQLCTNNDANHRRKLTETLTEAANRLTSGTRK